MRRLCSAHMPLTKRWGVYWQRNYYWATWFLLVSFRGSARRCNECTFASVKGLSDFGFHEYGNGDLIDGTSKAPLQWLCNYLGISTENAAAPLVTRSMMSHSFCSSWNGRRFTNLSSWGFWGTRSLYHFDWWGGFLAIPNVGTGVTSQSFAQAWHIV